jgi:hypothetical protein
MFELDKEFSLWKVKIEETPFWGRQLLMYSDERHRFDDVAVIIAYLQERKVKEFSINFLEKKRTFVVRKL